MPYDNLQGIRTYLEKNGIYGLGKDEQLLKVAQSVAAIPWGEGRTIEEVLSTKNVGTCTGKHVVLQACFDELGITYNSVVCTFRWGDQRIQYPEHLKSILAEGEWEHGHNFVQISGKDGNVIDLDITWDQKLRPYGFRSFPANWDGRSSFIGVNNIIKRWDNVEISRMKKELIGSLTDEQRGRRERFLKEFVGWVDSLRH